MKKERLFILFVILFILGSSFAQMERVYADDSLPQKAGKQDSRRSPFDLTPDLREYFRAQNPETGTLEFKPLEVRITGIMMVAGKIMATAEVESLGSITLKRGMKVSVSVDDAPALSFTVKRISKYGVVVVFENGNRVTYRYRPSSKSGGDRLICR